MRHGRTAAPARDRARADQERSLTTVRFVGSYPTADFGLDPALPEIAFIGRSNVGKSSLLNALVGRRNLARTSGSPGKTRLCNVFVLDDACYLVDLPGYGYARTSKADRAGYRRLLEGILSTRPTLAGAVWLLDIRHAPSRDDHAMAALFAEHGVPVLVVLTKADKVSRGQRAGRLRAIAAAVEVPEDQCLVTSAQKKEGLEDLRASVDALIERAGAA